VDTGLGVQDYRNMKRLGSAAKLLGIQGTEELSAFNQIKKLGFSVDDVRHIIPTHLHLDHAGGIYDFPAAKVHTLRAEYNIATSKAILLSSKYRDCQWSKETKWEIHEENSGEHWFGFDMVRALAGVTDDILIIPLVGHTEGHFGVAVKSETGWLLHAGDAYYHHKELDAENKMPMGWKLFEVFAHSDFSAVRKNQKRLKELRDNHSEVTIISSHDTSEFLKFAK
jgi:glyoxylase-like metal-dependent hydrolase (beta-lactamase superfamily II)